MCDMEVHEHVVVNGPALRLQHKILHRNVTALFVTFRSTTSIPTGSPGMEPARHRRCHFTCAVRFSQGTTAALAAKVVPSLARIAAGIFRIQIFVAGGILDGIPA